MALLSPNKGGDKTNGSGSEESSLPHSSSNGSDSEDSTDRGGDKTNRSGSEESSLLDSSSLGSDSEESNDKDSDKTNGSSSACPHWTACPMALTLKIPLTKAATRPMDLALEVTPGPALWIPRHQNDRHQNNATWISEAKRKNQTLEESIQWTEAVIARRMRADCRFSNPWN